MCVRFCICLVRCACECVEDAMQPQQLRRRRQPCKNTKLAFLNRRTKEDRHFHKRVCLVGSVCEAFFFFGCVCLCVGVSVWVFVLVSLVIILFHKRSSLSWGNRCVFSWFFTFRCCLGDAKQCIDRTEQKGARKKRHIPNGV